MKLIIRVDDVGYTNVHNIGTYKTIEQGIATAADVMLDTPGTEDALHQLKKYPWISVGWHSHFWGSPVLGKNKVPSLVAENGHFRSDLTTAEDVSYQEALAELRAQLDRCKSILGYTPKYREFMYADNTPFGRAMADVTKEYEIATKYMKNEMTFMPPPNMKLPDGIEMPKPGAAPFLMGGEVDPRWVDRKIFYANLGGSASMTDSIADAYAYDPLNDFMAGANKLLEHSDDRTYFSAWHPGYVDHYVMKEGDQGFNAKAFILCRPVDVEALCDPKFQEWIKENNVELVNFNDAIFGTDEYQTHLREIGSPLAVSR